MSFIKCRLAQAPIRVLPDHKSEMSSQFLFGETGKILKTSETGWAYIQCSWDGYKGWVRLNQFDTPENLTATECITRSPLTSVVYKEKKLLVSAGAEVTPGMLTDKLISNENECKESFAAKIKHNAAVFLHAPYCWGGRSVLGIDCSGFVQVVFKLSGISLLRDAVLQQTQGIPVDNLADAECGDLVFFDDPAGLVSHVGIMWDKNQVIHSSGEVKIETITGDGIISNENDHLTHRLYSIKRIR